MSNYTAWRIRPGALEKPYEGKYLILMCGYCSTGTETLVYDSPEGNEINYYHYCPHCGADMFAEGNKPEEE